MFKAPWEVRALERHVDPRGFLCEILRFQDEAISGGGQLYFLTVNPGQRRGDHFHHQKHEWFICVSGAVEILLAAPNKEKLVVAARGEQPQLIYCAPGTAHAMRNVSDAPAILVSYGSQQHDSQDPDTFPLII